MIIGDRWRNRYLKGRRAGNSRTGSHVRWRKKDTSQEEKKKRGQSLFQSFKPVIKCDNLNSNPKRKFGREW